MIKEINYAPEAFKLLNGVFCIYKPSFVGFKKLREMILTSIIKDLNQMKTRPLKKKVVIEGGLENEHFKVKTIKTYSDSPLVIGPRHQVKDFSLAIANYIGFDVSGLVLVGIRSKGCILAKQLLNANYIKEYEIKCKLGKSTENFFEDGKLIEESNYKHVTRNKMHSLLNKIQTSQQTEMYKTMGVNLNSQTAYELACKGMIRPSSRKTNPIIYSLKFITFDPPDFTINIKIINENPLYLKHLVNDIGLELRTNACVSTIKCIRYGPFTYENSLLKKYWNVENIIQNIINNSELVEKYKKNENANLINLNNQKN